jgi:hypothetical protein
MGIVLPGSEYLCSAIGGILPILYKPALARKDYTYTKDMNNTDYITWTEFYG